MRASDADRDKYLELLREAFSEGRLDPHEYDQRMGAALESKTYGELYAVLEQLPVDPARVPGPPLPSNPSLPSLPGGPGHLVPVPAPMAGGTALPTGWAPPNSITAIFSSTARDGAWIVPATQDVFALFGEVKLDLTGAVLSEQATELRLNAVLGSVRLTVPDAVNLEVNGTGILGEFEQRDKRKGADKRRAPAPGAPTIRITGVALLGEVEIRTVVPKPHAVLTMLNRPQLGPGPQPPQIEPPHPGG